MSVNDIRGVADTHGQSQQLPTLDISFRELSIETESGDAGGVSPDGFPNAVCGPRAVHRRSRSSGRLNSNEYCQTRLE